MALYNRVRVSTTTTGTGDVTLGPAFPGYQNFTQAGVPNGATVSYVIEDGTAWELGTGTFTSPDQLTRSSILESSNSDNTINLTGGAVVFIDALASDFFSADDLSEVAVSGDYDDLINKPTLGSAAATDSTDYATAAQGNLADTAVQPGSLATVATSGNYNDLNSKPTLFSGSYNDLSNKPSTFPPEAHTHTASQISDASINGRSLITAADYAAMRGLLTLVIGTNVQAQNANLEALAGLTGSANTTNYFTGAGAMATTSLTSFGRSLIDDADAATARTTLGLTIGTNVQAYNAKLGTLAGQTWAADRYTYYTSSSAAAIGTITSFGRSLIDDADASAARTTLGTAYSSAANIRSASSGSVISPDGIESSCALVTLSYSSTVSIDWDSFVIGNLVCSGNPTIGNPTNVQPGVTRCFFVFGDNSTERSLVWSSAYKGNLPDVTVTSSRGLLISLTPQSSSLVAVSYVVLE